MDRTGARRALLKTRARLVHLIEGDHRSSNERLNSRDDFHLKLLIRFALRVDSNCLEVGTNRGKFLKDICRVAPDGHHIAYEPIPRLREDLTRRFPSVEVRQAALSDRLGQAEFVHVTGPGQQGLSGLADHIDLSSRSEVRTKAITVATERLDDHVPDGWLPDFVKIDVEGAEHLVLRGAAETLRRAKPIVAFEHGLSGGVSPEVYEFLCKHVGLRLFNMDGEGPLTLAQFVEQLHTRWNWVAHP
jgi:FkbM family methyltransferase